MNLAFFSKEASLKLKHAILLYEADANTGSPAATHATMHSVDTSSGRPIILPGRLATSEDLKTLDQGYVCFYAGSWNTLDRLQCFGKRRRSDDLVHTGRQAIYVLPKVLS